MEHGRLPTFLLVGAMKAGTTSLANWLGSHPEVYIPPMKETRYFNSPARFWLGEEWYRQQFAEAGDAVAVGDATPMMQNPVAVGHAARLLPEARLVALLRHPVDRAYSHYQHIRSIGSERRSFRAAARDELADPDRAPGIPPRDYVARSRYGDQLAGLEAAFSRQQLTIVLFDDLVERPEAVVAQVFAFLGADPEIAVPRVGVARDPRPGLRSPRVHAALQGPLGRRMPARARRLANRLNTRTARPYAAMDPDV